MEKIYLKYTLDWIVLIGLGIPLILVGIETDKDVANELLIIKTIIAVFAIIDEAIYWWRWSSKPLLIINQDTIYINKIGTLSLRDLQYIEIRSEGPSLTWPTQVLALKFKSSQAQTLLRKTQKEFFTLVRAPYSIANFTVKINRSLDKPWSEVRDFIEEKIEQLEKT